MPRKAPDSAALVAFKKWRGGCLTCHLCFPIVQLPDVSSDWELQSIQAPERRSRTGDVSSCWECSSTEQHEQTWSVTSSKSYHDDDNRSWMRAPAPPHLLDHDEEDKVRTSCSGVSEGKEMWQQSGGFTLWAANKDFPDETRASQATVSTRNTPQQLLLWLRQRSPPDVLTLNLFSLDTKKSGAKTRSIYLIRITNFYLRKLPPIMTKKDYFGRALYNGVNIVLPPLGNEIHSTVRNLWVTQVCQGSVWFTSATLNQQNTRVTYTLPPLWRVKTVTHLQMLLVTQRETEVQLLNSVCEKMHDERQRLWPGVLLITVHDWNGSYRRSALNPSFCGDACSIT